MACHFQRPGGRGGLRSMPRDIENGIHRKGGLPATRAPLGSPMDLRTSLWPEAADGLHMAAHEEDRHIVWDCPRWHGARASWSPRLLAAAADLPHQGPPKH